MQVQLSISSLLADLYQTNFNSSRCIFNGYFVAVVVCGLYYGFIVQVILVYTNVDDLQNRLRYSIFFSFYFSGFFRLCRVVYSTNRWLQFSRLYIIMIPIELIVVCPILVCHDIIYFSNEYYCFVLSTNICGMLWLILNIYVIPLLILLFLYGRIVLFIRQHVNNQSLLIKRKRERDLIAIRRIFITNSLLIVLLVPTLVLLFLAFITRVEHSLDHRIKMFSYALTMATLSVETVFVTPKLKVFLWKMWQRNRVEPIELC